jgi:hypothetical protein
MAVVIGVFIWLATRYQYVDEDFLEESVSMCDSNVGAGLGNEKRPQNPVLIVSGVEDDLDNIEEPKPVELKTI